jgi:hypothetical protein
MAWRMSGTYVASCNCAVLCACPVDGQPTGPNGQCTGALVFTIDEGHLNDVDLSGVNFALYNFFPSNLTSGNWKIGIVIDEGASDQQAGAIQQIVSGDEGGPFAEFTPLIGEMLGVERARVSFSDGDTPSGSIEGKTDFTFDPLKGPDGSPTTIKNAMFGFAPEYKVGNASGRSDAFGLSFEARYGESAHYEFSDAMAGEIHPRA